MIPKYLFDEKNARIVASTLASIIISAIHDYETKGHSLVDGIRTRLFATVHLTRGVAFDSLTKVKSCSNQFELKIRIGYNTISNESYFKQHLLSMLPYCDKVDLARDAMFTEITVLYTYIYPSVITADKSEALHVL